MNTIKSISYIAIAAVMLAGCDRMLESVDEKYLRLGQEGKPLDQCNLAYQYEEGYGDFPKDETKAAEWYKKAADQDYSHALMEMGERYMTGKGVAVDRKAAADMWRRAAVQDDEYTAKAAIYLSMCYKYGCGVPVDDAEAMKWYLRAAEKDEIGAKIMQGDSNPAEKGDKAQ